MGQSSSSISSSSSSSKRRDENSLKSTAVIVPEKKIVTDGDVVRYREYISELPDDCLGYVFHSLNSGDRKSCSLVCKRWLVVEGQSRHRLSLNAKSDLNLSIETLFTRFDSVTKLALKCERKGVSIGDDALILISLRCRNLTRLKLRACREITDAGMEAFVKNCKGLKKLSFGSCTFGAKGMNAILNNCSFLEELSVKRLRGIADGGPAVPIGPGVAAGSLKFICLKELYNGQCFGPLIAAAKNLRSLKLFRCSGDWDVLLESISDRVTGLVDVHLERLQVSDCGIAALSSCLDLEVLHLVKTPECTNAALVSIADRCKSLRKLHIDGWKTNRIGDEGLMAIAKRCLNLQEMVLIGVNPTNVSLGHLGNCRNLERLALCGSETIGDSEISCIAAKCTALKKLCIKGCPVSNHAMEALVGGCPNLVKVKVKKCRGVTSDGVIWFRAFRQSVVINLDIIGKENPEASTSDGGPPEPSVEVLAVVNQITASIPSSSDSRTTSSSPKARLGLFVGRNFASCTFPRWSNSNNSDAV